MLCRGRDKKDFFLTSLLYDSIEFRDFQSLKTLLKEADPNLILPKRGIAPFHLAIGCDPYDFALKATSEILQKGGNPNVKSDDGLTPLHIAAAWGRTEIVKLLLKNGGDPEVRDSNYKTPLHYASRDGHIDCLELLTTYLPGPRDVINNEEENHVKLVLDKILVNNGAFIGEYTVKNEGSENSIITNEQNHLQSLPQTDTNDYILNWFTKQESSLHDNSTESTANSLTRSTSLECSESSLDESDADEEAKRFDARFITFRKVYRKTRSKTKSYSSKCQSQDTTYFTTNSHPLNFTPPKDFSTESGIVTLQNSLDSGACSQNSINSFEKNVLYITDDLSGLNLTSEGGKAKPYSVRSEGVASQETSFYSVSEVYKYVDEKQDVVLYQRRLQKLSGDNAKSVKSSTYSSKLSSLPEAFDYDADALRNELTQLGFNPGPITITTKRIYLKKLHHLKKSPVPVQNEKSASKVYSRELEQTLRNPNWYNNLVLYKSLEEEVLLQFSNPNRARKWREGVNKSSFTYLLLDPRITNNLPNRVEFLKPEQVWETFLSAIFYVGKGKRSRPYQHLYEAVGLWKKGEFTTTNKKLQTILDIWQAGGGVVCLHVFQNVIPVEAYTREAAMISAINIKNLTNIKSGEFYGVSDTWSQKQKAMLGVYLLYKAMSIFLNEGERQLSPTDID